MRPTETCTKCDHTHTCQENGLPEHDNLKTYTITYGDVKYKLEYIPLQEKWEYNDPDNYPEFEAWFYPKGVMETAKWSLRYKDEYSNCRADGTSLSEAAKELGRMMVMRFEQMGEILGYDVED